VVGGSDGSDGSAVSGWKQPPQNSIPALRHGIEMMDGIEFDLRMSTDGELFLHHNSQVERDADDLAAAGAMPFVEENEAATMRDLGFGTFDDLLAEPAIRDAWLEGGHTLVIELKRPHRISRPGGEKWSRPKRDAHMRRMLEVVDSRMTDLDAADCTAAVISFDQRIHSVAREAGVGIPVAPISPFLPTFGSELTKRAFGSPSFMRRSVPALARRYAAIRAPFLPLAYDHIAGITRFLHLGRSAGLSGRGLEVLRAASRVKPMAIWPTPIEAEAALEAAGLWRITDVVDPTVLRLPNGLPRWTKPATRPLDAEWRQRLDAAGTGSDAEVADLLAEATSSIAPWQELSPAERNAVLDRNSSRHGLPESNEALHGHASQRSIPWRMPRSIAHRGAGNSRSEN